MDREEFIAALLLLGFVPYDGYTGLLARGLCYVRLRNTSSQVEIQYGSLAKIQRFSDYDSVLTYIAEQDHG